MYVSQLPQLNVAGGWDAVFLDKTKTALEDILPKYIKRQRWFGGKARRIKRAGIRDVLPVPNVSSGAHIVLVQVDYMEGDPEVYTLPLIHASGDRAEDVLREHQDFVVARVRVRGGEEGVLYEAVVEEDFCKALLEAMARRRKRKGEEGEFLATPTRVFSQLRGAHDSSLEPSILQAEQSNTSVIYGERFILKLFRRPTEGVNPDLELGRFLTERGFDHSPPVAGAVEYRKDRQEPVTLAILHGFVPNEGDAWEYTLDVLGHYFEHAMAGKAEKDIPVLPEGHMLDLAEEEPPPEVFEIIGNYLESARLLGQRTAELHIALGSAPEDPVFCPEPFSKLYQRALYQSMRTLAGQVFRLLSRSIKSLPETVQPEAGAVLGAESQILGMFQTILRKKITAMRLRCHGDFHLGQVLNTGKDFVIMDFEGEPVRPIGERRIKRSPLRDVAGMLRSFHYADYSALFSLKERGLLCIEDLPPMEAWARFWHFWVCVIFLKAYLDVAGQGTFLPAIKEELRMLLDLYLLEKAVYELGYELNNRPDWVKIPLQGIRQLLEQQ